MKHFWGKFAFYYAAVFKIINSTFKLHYFWRAYTASTKNNKTHFKRIESLGTKPGDLSDEAKMDYVKSKRVKRKLGAQFEEQY